MPYLSHKQFDFYYEDHGKGFPFVFLHGLGGSLEQPLSLFPPTSGNRVCSLDFRYHGRTISSGPFRKCSFNQFADDVVAMILALRIKEPVIGGISMGAAVTITIAHRHPDIATSFVAVRPAWLSRPRPPNLAPLAVIAKLIKQLGLKKAERAFRRSTTYLELAASSPDNAESLLRQFSRPQAATGTQVLTDLINDAPYSKAHQLRAITKPFLLLANHHDPLHPFATASYLAGLMPNATVVPIASKNDSVKDHLGDVRRVIDSFLRAERPPAKSFPTRFVTSPA